MPQKIYGGISNECFGCITRKKKIFKAISARILLERFPQEFLQEFAKELCILMKSFAGLTKEFRGIAEHISKRISIKKNLGELLSKVV